MRLKDMEYKRVDVDLFRAEMNNLTKRITEASSGEEQMCIHREYYDVINPCVTMMVLAQMRADGDVTDEFYRKEVEFYDEYKPIIRDIRNEYEKSLLESKFRPYLESILGEVVFASIENAQKSSQPSIIPLMQEENALITKYENILASAKIEYDGKELNLSLMRPYLTNVDREVRKSAYKAYTGFFVEMADELDSIYDQLVKLRDKMAKQLGYKNYIELGYYRMNRNSYSMKDVETFREQIKTYFVPYAYKLHEIRRKRLGLDKLSYIDEGVLFNNGNPAPVLDAQGILAAGQKMYSELSEQTREFFDYMMANELFDVFGRKNKRGGGYMDYLPSYGSPIIFANFNGTSGDVDVITHECGHAFQGYLSGKGEYLEHMNIGMETAEIHSMSMEFFTEPWMESFFGDRYEDYISMHIEESVFFIPYGTMVDEFQHIVYENPNMTCEERRKAWLELEKVYRPHMNYEDNEFFSKGGFWQKQHHIYSMPFYYIDYVLAQICAFQFKNDMDKDYKGAWDRYVKLCELSASDYYTNMLKEVGLEIPFAQGCIKKIVEDLERIR